MSKYPMVRLEDVCDKATSSIAQKDLKNLEGIYPIYGASGFIKNINFYKQDREYIAIVKDGAGIGRAMILPAFSSVIGTMQYILPKDNIITKYLYFAIDSMNLAKYFTGATIPHIYFKDYKNEFLPLPPIENQRSIIKILESIVSLIIKRKQQLSEFDELAKSRFIEMFGDPILNPYGFEVKKLGEVCRFYTGTGFPNIYQGKTDGDFPFYKVGDISNNTEKGLKKLEHCNNYINKDIVYKIRGTIVPPDTVVFAKIGEALKLNRRGLTIRDCLVDNNVIGIKPKEELNINYFFQFMQDLDMEEYSASTTVPSIRKTTLEKIPILVPNFDIQNKYNTFIEQLDKSKFRAKKCLKLFGYMRHLWKIEI